jgi:hypothetical protein
VKIVQSERLGTCLLRLFEHTDANAVALTGSAAIDVQLSARGLPRCRGLLTDVDLVAGSPGAVAPGVTSAFLLSHYHLPHPGYQKFLVQLADPQSRLRVDIFPGSAASIDRARAFDVGGARVRVLDLDAILDHKRAILAGASEERRVDEKHYLDAVMLARICGQEVPDCPASFLRVEQYSREIDAECHRCRSSADAAFPLAPKQRILDTLGYV